MVQAAETDDAKALLELHNAFEERDPPLPSDLLHWLVQKAFIAGSDRLDEFSHESAPVAALELRSHLIDCARIAGELIPDVILTNIVCPKCGNRPKPEMHIPPESQYSDGLTFIGWALHMCYTSQLEVKPTKCRRCKVPMQLAFADCHHWQDGQQDLVLRCFFSGSGPMNLSYGLMFWSKSEGYSVISRDELSEIETCEEMLARAAKLFIANERVWATEVLKRVLRDYPESSLLIDFVEHLDHPKERGLMEAIVAGHLHQHPADPRGHYWNATILIEAFIEFPQTEENLLAAQKHIKTALDSHADWKEAQLKDCMIARLRLYPAHEVKAKYEALVNRHAFFAEAYYDYALFMMETDPVEAFRLFSQGAALEPEDPEYLVGKARTLMMMGKEAEAHEEFTRARRMNPEHPGVIKAERMFKGHSKRGN